MSGLTSTGAPDQGLRSTIIRSVIIFLSVVMLALSGYALSIYSTPISDVEDELAGLGSSSSSTSQECRLYPSLCARKLRVRQDYTGAADSLISALASGWSSAPPAFLIFVAIWTAFTFGGVLIFEKALDPRYLYRIGVIIAYIVTAIFLLSGWAYMASAAGSLLGYSVPYYNYKPTFFKKMGGAEAGAAAAGAIAWVLCIVELVFFIMACRSDPGVDMSGEMAVMGPDGVVKGEGGPSVTVMQQPAPSPAPPYGYGAGQPQMMAQPHMMQPQMMQPQMVQPQQQYSPHPQPAQPVYQ